MQSSNIDDVTSLSDFKTDSVMSVSEKPKKKKKSVRMSVGFGDDPSLAPLDTKPMINIEEVATAEPSPPASRQSASFSFDNSHFIPIHSIDDNEKSIHQIDEKVIVQPSNSKPSSSASKPNNHTASHFRRIERLHRQQEVCCDVMKGQEEFKRPLMMASTMLMSWFCIPVIAIIICFGLIPFSSATDSTSTTQWRSLWAWFIITVTESALMTQVFSALVYEIEYGIVIMEEAPILYGKTAMAGTAAALTVHSIILGSSSTLEKSVKDMTSSRDWLAVSTAGFLVIAAVLWYEFNKHAPPTPETRQVAWQCLHGLAVVVLVSKVVYTVVAAIHAEYHLSGGGVVGYILAILYPFLKDMLLYFVERASPSGCNWGHQMGMLCSWPIGPVIVQSWHTVYLCLIGGTSATPIELAVMAFVQIICLYWEHRSSGRASKGSKRTLSPVNFRFSLMTDSKIDIYQQPGSDFADNSADQLPSIGSMGDRTASSNGTSSGIESPVGMDWGADSTPTPESSFDDDVEELQRITKSYMALLLGLIAPAAFLVASCILNVGPNRDLFDGRIWNLRAVSPDSGTSSQWNSSPASSTINGQANLMVGNLLCIMAFHAAGLLWAIRRDVITNKRSVLGTFSSAIMTHHSTTFLCAAVLGFLTVFGIAMRLFGMNAPF